MRVGSAKALQWYLRGLSELISETGSVRSPGRLFIQDRTDTRGKFAL